jgi:ferredoxin
MKVTLIARLCAGHGRCEVLAPEVFKVNDNWLADILMETPPESMRQAVENAARMCPTKAITIED